MKEIPKRLKDSVSANRGHKFSSAEDCRKWKYMSFQGALLFVLTWFMGVSIEPVVDEMQQSLLYLTVLQCMEAEDLLRAAGVSPHNSQRISVDNFIHICPILIVQLDSQICRDEHNDSHQHGHDDDDDDGLPDWLSSTAAGKLSHVINYGAKRSRAFPCLKFFIIAAFIVRLLQKYIAWSAHMPSWLNEHKCITKV